MENQRSLKKKTIGGLLWSFVDLLGNQGIQFIIQVILARMLIPDHFGLIGMILVFTAVSNSLIDSGFTQALIREQKVTQKDYSTVFYFNIIISLVIYLCLFAAAPQISLFFEESELTEIVRVLTLGIIINSFGIIPRAILTKRVDFKTQAKVNTLASVLSGVVAVTFAFLGFGVWSLVVRTLVLNFVQSLFLSLTTKWRPSLVFSIVSFKRLFGFGWKLLVSGLINTIYDNVFYLIIGKQYSKTQLGYFTNASKFNDLAVQTMTSSIERVTYPVLSSMQDQKERLKQNYKQIMRLTGFLIFPAMAGLAAVGEPLILVIFGAQWETMTIYFQLLCLAGMLYPIHALNLNILQVTGRSDLFLSLEILKMSISVVLIFFALWYEIGIVWLVALIVLDSYISLFINIYFSGKQIAYSVREQMKDLLPVYLITLFMGAAVYMAGQILPDYNLPKLIIQISLGIAIYITCCKVLKIKELNMVLELMIPLIKKIRFAKAN